MTPTQYDVIVVGLGAMGSATAWHLVKNGQRVLGVDQYVCPHRFGSSHGQTRIIREAYFEHPAYVPLVQRAYQLWSDLEQASGLQLLTQTGGLMIGRPESIVFSGAKASAEEHHLPHQVLSGEEVRQKFPGLTPPWDMKAVWEPRAGVLYPELCIQAHLELAQKAGAQFHFEEAVQQWEPEDGGVRIRTERASYWARQAVICAGAWAREVLDGLNLPLQVERQVQFWFEPKSEHTLFQANRLPVHLWEYEPGRFFYGFPDLGNGVKVAAHHQGVTSDPDQLDRNVKPEEIEQMRQILQRFVPHANGPLRSTAVCMYTNTPDGHFILDRHPHYAEVLIGSPCSGHGFKFASAIGEALADLALGRKPHCNLDLFKIGRLI